MNWLAFARCKQNEASGVPLSFGRALRKRKIHDGAYAAINPRKRLEKRKGLKISSSINGSTVNYQQQQTSSSALADMEPKKKERLNFDRMPPEQQRNSGKRGDA
ncbi:hypothetical protein GPALN_013472 [Globodera pallida]|nr:hypothetical protein GPALN_013472 [Globodera pallida]